MAAVRRTYDWSAIAAAARLADGVWRLHSDLRAVTLHTLQHMRRRVPAFDPTPDGKYEFARGNTATNEYGETIFDLYVRYVPIESETP